MSLRDNRQDSFCPSKRTPATDDLPEHLRSYDSLAQHFRGQLEDLSTTEKGDRFVHFVQKLVPQTEVGSDFDFPILREKKSYDEGVDLTAQGKDGRSTLYIQASLWIDRAEKIDSIVSNFQAYLRANIVPDEQYLLDLLDSDNQVAHFLVVTLSRLGGVLKRYKERELASEVFYQRWTQRAIYTLLTEIAYYLSYKPAIGRLVNSQLIWF